MTLHLLPFWEAATEGIQILLCGLIILFLIHNKIKYKRMILKAFPKDKSPTFSSEVFMQYLRQQTDHAFDSILQYINQERQSLNNSYFLEDPRKDRSAFVLGSADPVQRIDQNDKKGDLDLDGHDYAEIIALSNKGLNSKEISKCVNMARGEIELILRINHILVKSANKRLIRAKA